MKDWVVGKIEQLTGGGHHPPPHTLTSQWLFQIAQRDKRIAELERELQIAKAEWAAWKDVATLREHLIKQVRHEVECRHPVLLDSQKQPGVDIYTCPSCKAEVRINESVISRATVQSTERT